MAERFGSVTEEEEELGLATPGSKIPAPGEAEFFEHFSPSWT
jgi:hypothetical protein